MFFNKHRDIRTVKGVKMHVIRYSFKGFLHFDVRKYTFFWPFFVAIRSFVSFLGVFCIPHLWGGGQGEFHTGLMVLDQIYKHVNPI